MPYVAAMHGDIFYPTFLLRMILPTDVAMTWGFIIHVFLAGLFTYVFLRSLGLGFFGALVGGLAYMMSGNVAGLVSPGHDGKLFVSALLPLSLFFVVRGVRDGRQWAWGALAITVGLGVLSPHPQLLQYMLLVAGSLGLFLAFADTGSGKLPRATALRRLAAAAIAVVLGGAMGAIQYLPVREYVPWSPRALGKPWELATSYSMPPEEMVNFWVPQFSGVLDHYWGDNLHSPPQRVHRRGGDPAGGARVREGPAPHEPEADLVLHRRYDRRVALGARWIHAVLSARLRDRSWHEVLPRAEHDAVRGFVRRGGTRGLWRRARRASRCRAGGT